MIEAHSNLMDMLGAEATSYAGFALHSKCEIDRLALSLSGTYTSLNQRMMHTSFIGRYAIAHNSAIVWAPKPLKFSAMRTTCWPKQKRLDIKWLRRQTTACLNEMELASTVIGNEAGAGKDWAHHVQPLIQNGHAPDQRSGWLETLGCSCTRQ